MSYDFTNFREEIIKLKDALKNVERSGGDGVEYLQRSILMDEKAHWINKLLASAAITAYEQEVVK